MVSENVLSVGKYTETAIHLIHVLKIKKQFMQVICDHKLLTFIKKLKQFKKKKNQAENPIKFPQRTNIIANIIHDCIFYLGSIFFNCSYCECKYL